MREMGRALETFVRDPETLERVSRMARYQGPADLVKRLDATGWVGDEVCGAATVVAVTISPSRGRESYR
jgi:hypothetical protein